MSRESLASIMAATVSALPERPDPPSHLTEEEAQLWNEVVATKPADWFMRDSQPILASYCQAVVMHRELMTKWHVLKSGDVADFKALVEMVSKTANLSAQLATKLRLTPQSRYTPQSASTAGKRADGRKLWQK